MLSMLFNLSPSSFYSLLKKGSFLFVIMLVVITNPVHAKDDIPDKFKIALGGYSLIDSTSSLSLTEPNLGAGISISPEDTLGLNSEKTVLRLTGYYRFSKDHSLTYSWYSISSHGNKSLEKEFEWLDENNNIITIPIGASVDTVIDYDIYKVGYLWSFYHTDKVELSVGGGLHITRVAVGIRASATGIDLEAQDVATTVPLPVLSFSLGYNITPKFSWFIQAELFAIKFDEWKGVYADSSVGMEYRVFENVGLGIGLNTNALEVTQETSEYEFTFDNEIIGVLIYGAAYF